MKARIAKLIDVKSIMTLLLTIVFCVLACTGVISGADFLTIFTVVVAFYFGTQTQKKSDTAAGGYTGPQQGQTLPESVEPIYETVNTADVQKIHPPDAEPVAKVGFEY